MSLSFGSERKEGWFDSLWFKLVVSFGCVFGNLTALYFHYELKQVQVELRRCLSRE